MKKNIYILSFLFLSFNLYSQTEKETINFLNSMLSVYVSPMSSPNGVDQKGSFNIRTEIDPRSNQKVLVFELSFDQKLFSVYKVHGKHINGLISCPDPTKYTYLELVSSKGLIIRRWADENEEVFSNEIRIPLLNSIKEVEQIKKALTHLLKLNGANLPDTNLFKD
jgi:hypothetical protein